MPPLCRILLGLWLTAAALTSCADSGTEPPPPPPPALDTLAPSVPTNTVATATSINRIDISWSASTDNVGVTGYAVYRDSGLIANVTGNVFADSARVPGSEYCYAIAAFDQAGNRSGRSTASCATTVNLTPTARYSAPRGVAAGGTAVFDASSSTDSDGSIILYTFDFGDGTPAVSQSTPLFFHLFDSPGTRVVSLVITDNYGSVGTTAATITVGVVLGPAVNVSRTPLVLSQTPSLTSGDDGTIYMTWQEFGSEVLFARSTDGGQSFTAPVHVLDPDGPLGPWNYYYSEQMQIALSGSRIHVVWTIFDEFYGLAEIFHAASTDGGRTFSEPLMVSENDGVNSYGPSISIRSDEVGVAWANADFGGGMKTGAEYGRSLDGGASFATPVWLATSGLCPAVRNTAAGTYAAWTLASNAVFNQEQVHFARSDDGGATFSTSLWVDQLPQKSWCPHVVAASGAIYIVWEEGDAFVDRKIMFARSIDGGLSFSAAKPLSDPARDATCPFFTSGTDGRLLVSWSYADPAFIAVQSVLLHSSDGGSTFSPPLVIPQTNPTVGCFVLVPLTPHDLGVGWSERQADGLYSEIYYSRAALSGF